MDGAAKQQQIGQSLIRASSSKFGIESSSGHVYTREERQAALGRHTVDKLNISGRYLAQVGALGSLAGAAVGGIARAVGDHSLQTVALAGAAGATLSVMGAVANAKPMTPLQHAQYELEQANKDKAYLLETPMDDQSYQCRSSDIVVLQYMAERYQESWDALYLLWAGAHSPAYENDQEELLCEFYKVLYEKYGISRQFIDNLVPGMGNITTLEEAKKIPDFRRMLAGLNLSTEGQGDLVKLMFALCRIVAKNEKVPGGLSPDAIYQAMCKHKYCHYMNHLEQDIGRLEGDVRILRGMERQ
ncbi:hypothetical protein [Endozoicomonas sp. ONNA2]|uniref:hypothetical protein n=1 Tax=Endozoicomonas sp. ONNA2 TaxID=2828741 RepID=UPI002147D3C0|nr:hypothetical protein [Endozoicomonas sp. ONNA2]